MTKVLRGALLGAAAVALTVAAGVVLAVKLAESAVDEHLGKPRTRTGPQPYPRGKWER